MFTRQMASVNFIAGSVGFWKTLAFLVALVFISAPAVAAETASKPEALRSVATLVQNFTGDDVGDLFRAVRQANPSKGAIKTLRELNKAMAEGTIEVPFGVKDLIVDKMNAAQRRIKTGLMEARIAAYRKFASEHPREARTLYAIGDVGSWRSDDNINSDVDFTAFGTDREGVRQFVDQYLNPMMLEKVAGPKLGRLAQQLKYGQLLDLDIKEDFDIVVTPEGSEAEAKVFETRGGKKTAVTLMVALTPINPDGSLAR